MSKHRALNFAYIVDFGNIVRATYQPNLDLPAIQTSMREILMSYMWANVVAPDAELPLKDLVPYGCDFSFVLPTMTIYYTNKLFVDMTVD